MGQAEAGVTERAEKLAGWIGQTVAVSAPLG